MTSAPNRRWFRWSLRTMFVVVTVFCVWLGWNAKIVHQRAAMREQIVALGERGRFNPVADMDLRAIPRASAMHAIPMIWSVLGARPVSTIGVRFDDRTWKAMLPEIHRLFPEATLIDCSPLPEPTYPYIIQEFRTKPDPRRRYP